MEKEMNHNNIKIKSNDLNFFFEPNTIAIIGASDKQRFGFWNTRFLLKGTNRWYSAFYDLHKENKRIIIIEMFLGAILVLFPPIIFLYVLNKMMKISNKKYLKVKHIFTMFFFEFFENLQKVRTFLGKLTKKVETIGHFKGTRY